MTDEEILREYNDIVYNSETYKSYKSYEGRLKNCNNDVESAEKFVKFSKLLLLATIYFFSYSFFSESSLEPIIFVLIAAIFIFVSKKKLIKEEQCLDSVTKYFFDSRSNFNKLKEETPVPPIPQTMDNPGRIQELLAVFQSKRADTFKEALIIYEQDCQHRELVRRQNALIAAANNAQREVEEAKKVAEQAKRDADFARWDAEYHRWND